MLEGPAKRVAFLVFAAFLGSLSLHANEGFWSVHGFLAVIGMGGLLLMWGLSLRSPGMVPGGIPLAFFLVLYLAFELVQLSGILPGASRTALLDQLNDLPGGQRLFVVCGMALVLAWLFVLLARQFTGPRRLAETRLLRATFLALFVAGGVLTIEVFAPTPSIDIWHLNTEAARRLLHGEPLVGAPYVTPFYTFESYTYMPTEAVLRAPFLLLFGDVRYAGVAAMAAAYPLALRLAKAGGWPGQVPDVMAAIVLLQGDVLTLVKHSQSETLALPFVAWGLLAAHKGRVMGAAIAFGLAASIKLWLALLLVGVLPVLGWRAFASSVATYAGTVLPFAIMQPMKWLEGVLLFHLRLTDRLDGNTFAGVAHQLGWQWPSVVGTLAWVVTGALLGFLAFARRRVTASSMLVVVTAGLLGLFLLGKQGHANYYWILPGLLLLACAASPQRSRAEAEDEGKPVDVGGLETDPAGPNLASGNPEAVKPSAGRIWT